jgi:hypothetical protein
VGSGNWYRVLLLREPNTDDEVYLRSYAIHSTGAKKILQVHIKVEKVDAWRNAIFAGRGMGSSVIKGNVKVGGSMHILGTGEAGIVYAVSGNSELVNGYKSLDSGGSNLKHLISPDYIKHTTLSDGTEVETLEAVLRVKRGKVKIASSGANLGDSKDASGNAEAVSDASSGDPDYLNEYKSTLDSVFANEGFDEESFMDKVFADNYIYDSEDVSYDSDLYDLGDKVQMPHFNDDYDGQKDRAGNTCSDLGISCNIYKDYVDKLSVVATDSGGNAVCNLIPNTTGDFCSGCNSSGECVEPDPATCNKTSWDEADCGNKYGCIKWVSATGELYIEGRVKFDNSATGCAAAGENIIGNNTTDITYRGKGILYTEKNVDIRGDVRSYAGDALADEYFVKDHLLAVMSMDTMTLDAGIELTGAFYGLTNIVSGNNTKVLGSLMSNSFDMPTGGGGAYVYQVLGLSDELSTSGKRSGKRALDASK